MAELKEAPKTKSQNGPGQATEAAPAQPSAVTTAAREPFAPMARFAEQMDRLFEDFGLETWHMPRFFRRARGLLRHEPRMAGGDWSPRIDVFKREGQFVVHADLPGMTKDDIKVEVQDGLVTIHGERKDENEEEREGFYHSECSYGSFLRAIPLPEGAVASKASADFRKGVLEVSVPIVTPPEPKSRRLEIKETK
jgi:HSP20 family protein